MTIKSIVSLEEAGKIAYASASRPVNVVAIEYNMEKNRVLEIRDRYWRRFDELLDIMEKRVFDNEELREYEMIRKNIYKLEEEKALTDHSRRLLEKHRQMLDHLKKISPSLLKGNPPAHANLRKSIR